MYFVISSLMAQSLPKLLRLPNFSSIIGSIIVFFILIYLAERLFFEIPCPENVPLIREPAGARRFSWQTRLAFYTNCRDMFREAYENYSKKGIPVMIPGVGFRKELVMPVKSMGWILSQPDSSLSIDQALVDMTKIRWILGHEKIVADAWQNIPVKTKLNDNIENLFEALADELNVALNTHFGTDSENWKSLDLLPTLRLIVTQVASRFMVGLPLCRNQEYLRTVIHMNDLLVFHAGITVGAPLVLQPILGTLCQIPLRLYLRKMRKWFLPLLEERLETLKRTLDPKYQEPRDYIQMMLQFAAKQRPNELHDLELMLRRIAVQNFSMTYLTSLQITQVILNVLSSNDEFNTISVLREEVDSVVGPAWTRSVCSRMIQADSVARETLRLHSFSNRAIMRKVVVDGLLTEDGYVIPRGTIISFLTTQAGTTDRSYDDVVQFHPFRFSRARFASTKAAGQHETSPDTFVTTSTAYLPFGHGRHACPGRFLVDIELKMILAHILRDYDIQFQDSYKGKRPPNRYITEAVLPPKGVKIIIKRKGY